MKSILTGCPLFPSFLMGGFECASHKLASGRRLDLIAATEHDRYALEDYRRLCDFGMRVARDGIRWHLVEPRAYQHDFSSVFTQLRAARRTRTRVIWDICHYGWPGDLDILSTEFIRRFAKLARAFAQILADTGDETPFISPINEISFWAWAGGEVAYLNPFLHERGMELKTQLILATIEAIEAIWEVAPGARIVHADPLINIVNDPAEPEKYEIAESYRLSLYHSWDMIAGRSHPQLGGQEKYLDIIGVNYYPYNQWVYGDTVYHPERALGISDPLYRPLSSLLAEVYERYQRPFFIAETGTESDERVGWLRYVGTAVQEAIKSGIPVEGICLYPINNHPGWDDERHCHNGLWDYANESGKREIYLPLADELMRLSDEFKNLMHQTHCG